MIWSSGAWRSENQVFLILNRSSVLDFFGLKAAKNETECAIVLHFFAGWIPKK